MTLSEIALGLDQDLEKPRPPSRGRIWRSKEERDEFYKRLPTMTAAERIQLALDTWGNG